MTSDEGILVVTITNASLQLLDRTFPTPAENLACDEVLLALCEHHGNNGILRFWEPDAFFVVVGYTNVVEREVNVERCREAGIPIFRRMSGGGTVVQGPGCLDYTLILPLSLDPHLATIAGTNSFVMERMRSAIAPLIHDADVSVEGNTDLALNGCKINGNAQRRGKDFVLFHGVFLVQFDLTVIDRLLPMPSRQPEYRKNRLHSSFVRNAGVSFEDLKHALSRAWNAHAPAPELSIDELQHVAGSRYASPSWNHRK